MKIKDIVNISMFCATMCIISPLVLTIHFSPVPITLANFIIYIYAVVLGAKKATIATVIYIFIGIIGFPVFSNYTGGISKIVSPTGGYIIGFIFIALITGVFYEKFECKKMAIIGAILGTIICYIIGTIWLKILINKTFLEALIIGVLPYIFLDLIKIVLAISIGDKIKKVIKTL